jgi:hypothetical protein
MDIGSVLGESWELYKRFFTRFFAIAAVVFVVLDLVSAILNAVAGSSVVAALFWALVSLVLGIVGTFWVQGALVTAVDDVRDGRADLTIGETFERVAPRLPALIAAGIVAGIAIGIGFLLLIVPGLFLLTIWSLLVPVIVLESRRAGESFGRSQELVRGNGWSVFGVVIIVVILSGIVHGILRAILSFLPAFFSSWIGGVVADSVTAPFIALALTVMYYRLRGVEPVTAPSAQPI